MTVTATKRMMATATTVAGNEEGNGDVVGKQIDIALINYRIFLYHDVFLRT